jgi:hypothetical protein
MLIQLGGIWVEMIRGEMIELDFNDLSLPEWLVFAVLFLHPLEIWAFFYFWAPL